MAKDPKEAVPASQSHEQLVKCISCGSDLASAVLYQRYRVCPFCRFHYTISAAQRIEFLVDPRTFRETNESLVPLDPLSFADRVPYKERIAEAQRVTGLTEAVITGTGHIGGVEAVLAVLDYGFMGGSIGSAVGEKITKAAEMSAHRRLPFVLVAAGGAPRIQEGVLALMQMPKMAMALRRLGKKGIPFISILSSPATGHLLAASMSMADIVFAEPGAIIGFAPKRLAEEATKDGKTPQEFQTADFYLAHGMIDAIVDRRRLKQQLALALDLLGFKYRLTIANRSRLRYVERPAAPAWERVQLARHEQRPTARDYIERIVSNFVELHGDRIYGDDPVVVTGIGYLAGEAVMVIGQDRGKKEESGSHHEGYIYPEGFRKARRAMRLAAKFRLPLVTFVDTQGAYPGLAAEERGLAGAFGLMVAEMAELPTPVLSAIIGEGGSEGALAFSVADRLLMMENAIYTPISPEAAALILYRDSSRANQVAASLKLTAEDCVELGIVDGVVPEPEEGAHTNIGEAARQLERLLVQSLLDVQMTFTRTLLRNRAKKFRKIGSYGTLFEVALASEADKAQESFVNSVQDVVDRVLGRESDPHRRNRKREDTNRR